MAIRDLKTSEKVLKSLANRRRLAILKFLKRHGAASVGEISKEIKLSFKSTSRHLAILSALNLVTKYQDRLKVFYEISPSLDDISKEVIKLL
jgi:DNA-binding transcriptional ArsR family regulator